MEIFFEKNFFFLQPVLISLSNKDDLIIRIHLILQK